MIIKCDNCNKKFNVNSDLIPDKGRLVKCSSCNHKWFFTNKDKTDPIKVIKDKNFEIFESINSKLSKSPSDIEKLTIEAKETIVDEKDMTESHNTILNDTKDKVITKRKKKSNFLSLIIVFIISFMALIIFTDTLAYPISIIIPNIEYLLYNLYETIKDIKLFILDLI